MPKIFQGEIMKSAVTLTGPNDRTKGYPEALIHNFLEQIAQEVSHGNDVCLIDFGTFKHVIQPAKKGTTPDGVAFDVAEKAVVRFFPGKALRDTVARSAAL